MIISWAVILKLMGGKKKSAREAPPPPPGSLCAEFVARLKLPHHHRWNSQVTWGGHLAALQGRRVTLPHVDGREVNGGFYPPGPALFIRVGTGYTDDPLRRRKKKKTLQTTNSKNPITYLGEKTLKSLCLQCSSGPSKSYSASLCTLYI